MGETKPVFVRMGWFDKLGIAHTGLPSRRVLFPGFRFAPL